MKESLLKELSRIPEELENVLRQVRSEPDWAEAKAAFLGKKGKLTDVLKGLGRLSPDERPEVGARVNEIKADLEARFQSCLQHIKDQAIESTLGADLFDPSLPARSTIRGHLHPVTQVYNQIKTIFEGMGFTTFAGPEVEDDYHNFAALNIPADHPARDLQDTFYLSDGKRLLRTHTSTVQIHVMEKMQPPIRMIAPGAVYRCDSDVTHTPMFHQIEGLWVDESIRFSDLKGVLTAFVTQMYGPSARVRFRPSFFPFTEPSAELDMSCVFCRDDGALCPVCKGTGWLEILGCGMVDPAVLAQVGYDSEKYTGFAFGMGLERQTMLKFGINDLRLFFENDIRFLEQF